MAMRIAIVLARVVFICFPFYWFRYDFAENERSVVEYTISYIDSQTAEDIKISNENIKIKYISYDWSLNGKWN